jgi:hypothetical protein
LAEMIQIPHPDNWYICTYCNGTGRRPICNRKGRRSRKQQRCYGCDGDCYCYHYHTAP